MQCSLLRIAVLATAAFGLTEPSLCQGGVYRGPKPIIPSRSIMNGTSPPASGPGRPGPPVPQPPQQRRIDHGDDLSIWDYWWAFNKDRYIRQPAQRDSGPKRDPDQELIRTGVVPALKNVLGTEAHKDIRTGALFALAKIGDVQTEDDTSELMDIFAPFLKSKDREVQENAVLALGVLCDERSLPALVGLLRDDAKGKELAARGVPFRARAFAAHGLGLIGQATTSNTIRETIVEQFIAVLEAPEEAYPDVKVGALSALGLTPLDWTSDALTRPACLRYLQTKLNPSSDDGGLHDYRARAQVPIAMARLLATHDAEFPTGNEDALAVRAEVIEQLLEIAGVASTESHVEVIQSAVIALGMIASAAEGEDAFTAINTKIFDELRRIAKKSADNQTESFALMALAQMGSRPGPGDSPRGLQDDVRNALLQSLSRAKGKKKPWAGLALGVFGNELRRNGGAAEPLLAIALRRAAKEDTSVVDYGAYAIGLGLLDDDGSAAMLLERLVELGEGQDDVRSHICIGLGLMQASSASEALGEIAQDHDPRRRPLSQAAVGLGLLGDKAAIPLLLGALRGGRSRYNQAAIAGAVGGFGADAPIESLVAIFAGETGEARSPATRAFAAVALGIACDKAMEPWNMNITMHANYRAHVPTLTNPYSRHGVLDHH